MKEFNEEEMKLILKKANDVIRKVIVQERDSYSDEDQIVQENRNRKPLSLQYVQEILRKEIIETENRDWLLSYLIVDRTITALLLELSKRTDEVSSKQVMYG